MLSFGFEKVFVWLSGPIQISIYCGLRVSGLRWLRCRGFFSV